MTFRPMRVLVVDDSAVVRKMLTDALSKEPGIEVVGSAADVFIARDLILKHNPDVMTLDIEMPRMDGLTFLRRVMEYKPMPVIIVSSITQKGSAASVEALQIGAIDVIAKPGGPGSVGAVAEAIAARIRALRNKPVKLTKIGSAAPAAPTLARPSMKHPGSLIVVGASTGGTQAIESLLTRMPADIPPMLIVQHMPAGFTKAFADRLNAGIVAAAVGLAPSTLLRDVSSSARAALSEPAAALQRPADGTPNPPFRFGHIDFEGGARVLMKFTDTYADELQVGLPLQMVYRIKDFDRQRGFRCYFWKATPRRGEAA